MKYVNPINYKKLIIFFWPSIRMENLTKTDLEKMSKNELNELNFI